MNIVNLRAGQTSQPFLIGVGAVVGVLSRNVGSWSAYFEYSYTDQQSINANTATWTTWPGGTVTTATNNTALYPMFIRCVCVTGQVEATFGDSTNSTAIPGVPWS